MNNSYFERKDRFELINKSWNLNKIHDLMLSYNPPVNLINDYRFSIMLYISKAFYFDFTFDEELFITRLDNHRHIRDNITPNGAVVPKKEFQLEFNMVLRAWNKIVQDMIKNNPDLLSRINLTPNIRIKFGEELEENIGRPTNTSYPHSDAWLDDKWGINCFVPVLGDVENNNLHFWKPKNVLEFDDKFIANAPTFAEMQWVLEYYDYSPELTPKKGLVHISDFALIHGSYRSEKTPGTRISTDTTIFVQKIGAHSDRQNEYADNFRIIGEDVFLSTSRSINEEKNVDKKTSFSHYNAGSLKVHECQ